MATYTVTDSKEYKDPEPGVYYGFLKKIEKGTSKEDSEFLKWYFESEEGEWYTAITDSEDPTTKNKFGRFLCGLKGSPLAGDVNPDDYIGKRYALVYTLNRNGKSAMSTISPCK